MLYQKICEGFFPWIVTSNTFFTIGEMSIPLFFLSMYKNMFTQRLMGLLWLKYTRNLHWHPVAIMPKNIEHVWTSGNVFCIRKNYREYTVLTVQYVVMVNSFCWGWRIRITCFNKYRFVAARICSLLSANPLYQWHFTI